MKSLKSALIIAAWTVTVCLVVVSAQAGVDIFLANWRWAGALACVVTTLYFANRLSGKEAIMGGHFIDADTGPVGKLISDALGFALYAMGVWIMFFRD